MHRSGGIREAIRLRDVAVDLDESVAEVVTEAAGLRRSSPASSSRRHPVQAAVMINKPAGGPPSWLACSAMRITCAASGVIWSTEVPPQRGQDVVGQRGLEGHRTWAVHTADGGIGSGKTTRRFRRVDGLPALAARLEDDE